MEAWPSSQRLAKDRWQHKPGADRKRSADREGDEREPDRALVCSRCGREITRESARIEVNGLHEHSQINPHGYIWNFGCFSSAPGCVPEGVPTTEFSWFAGASWQLLLCGQCALHLGWLFREPDRSFCGLILDRLAPE